MNMMLCFALKGRRVLFGGTHLACQPESSRRKLHVMEEKDSVPLQTIPANERQAYSCQNPSHLPERFSLVVTSILGGELERKAYVPIKHPNKAQMWKSVGVLMEEVCVNFDLSYEDRNTEKTLGSPVSS